MSDSSLSLSSDDEINSAAVGAMTLDRNAKLGKKDKEKKDKEKKDGKHPPTEVQFRINKYDDTAKILRFPTGKHTPVSAVVKAMCETLGLQPTSHALFALWLEGDHLQLQMKSHHEPAVVQRQWPDILEKFTYGAENEECRFLFKRDAFVSKQIERKVRDPIAINLLFHEARQHVINSLYPCNADDAVYLAAILMQLTYGDHNPSVHKEGFLVNGLTPFIPKHLLKKSSEGAGAVMWEAKVLAGHKQYAGKNDKTILHLLYLQYVWQWPIYGSVFFYGTMEAPQVGTVMREMPDIEVRVGVTTDGLHVVNDQSNQLIHSFHYDDICWDTKMVGALDVFFVEYGPEEAAKELAVITPQASLLDTFVSRAVDQLDEADEAMEQKRLEQAGVSEAPKHRIETGNSPASSPKGKPKNVAEKQKQKQGMGGKKFSLTNIAGKGKK